jgi:hypothetical protein
MHANEMSSHGEIVARQPRRFSEGMERVPVAPETLRVGRYSDGLAPTLNLSAANIGSYADGLVERPAVLRVGSFGDVEKPVARRRRARRVAEAAPVHP